VERKSDHRNRRVPIFLLKDVHSRSSSFLMKKKENLVLCVRECILLS